MIASELIDKVAVSTGLSTQKVKTALNNFQNTIGEELNAGHEVQISGFGNFVIVSYPSHTVLNPRDPNQKIVTLPAKVAKFRPHPELTNAIKNQPDIKTDNKTPDIPNNITPEKDAANSVFIPYADLSNLTVPKKILALIPEHVARHYQAAPIDLKNDKIVVAMIDPEDREAIEFIKKKTGLDLDLRLCTQSDLNHVLDQYSGMSGELKQIVDSVEDDELAVPKDEEKKKANADEITETAPAAKIIQSIVKRAVREKASDIHIEPTEEQVIIRFRVDGVLKKIITLPIEILPALVSRIKILSGMKIDETRLPQDGRFQAIIDQSEVDFRVSTFPTVNGEKVVARILDKSAGIISLEKLGFRGSAFKMLENNITKSHGMILSTGPTGSGKTTTLYAILQKLMNEKVNIVTLEDPVEYRISTINQGQIKANIGFSFASGLRSILRQDPDVIMVGEIRDYETADMAIHSALTGHIVLSTLHTNDAPGAIPRFMDMKIEPFLINSSLNVVVAQRLCRKICESCKQPLELDQANSDFVKQEIDSLPKNEPRPPKIQFFMGKGCPACENTGYKGRIGIYEVFELSNDIKVLVAKKASGTEIGAQAIANGMVTLRQDGILKAIDGLTTLEEIWRVTKD